jgi:hypothetical protein
LPLQKPIRIVNLKVPSGLGECGASRTGVSCR